MKNPLRPRDAKYLVKASLAKVLFCAALAPLLLVSPALGAMITWGSATTIDLNDNSSVITTGSLISAFYMNPDAGTTSINGVTFTDWQHAANATFSGNALMNNTRFWANPGGYPTTPAYAALLGYTYNMWDGTDPWGPDYAAFAHPIVLSGLTDGQTYQVQIWTPFADGPGANSSTRYSGNAPTLSPYDTATNDSPLLTLGNSNATVAGITANPQYVIGTFIATGTTQSIWFHGVENGGQYVGVIGALQLRAVPEPSTWALAGLGAFAVIFRLRRPRRA